jgi:hypothetical protein
LELRRNGVKQTIDFLRRIQSQGGEPSYFALDLGDQDFISGLVGGARPFSPGTVRLVTLAPVQSTIGMIVAHVAFECGGGHSWDFHFIPGQKPSYPNFARVFRNFFLRQIEAVVHKGIHQQEPF